MIVIAGHNGAGKTTIYDARLRHILAPYIDTHINPDKIEQDLEQALSGQGYTKEELEVFAAEEANRLRRTFLQAEINFSFETVFSDLVGDKAAFMEEARRRGYNVVLLAVGLESIEKSKQRVAYRYEHGGHYVKPEKLEARYPRVLANFALGTKAASLAIFMDNSTDAPESGQGCYRDVAFFEDGSLVSITDDRPEWWAVVAGHLSAK